MQVHHLVAPRETHLAHIWTRWQQCTTNSHCYKSTSSSPTSLHGPTRIRRGGVPSKFHQTAGGPPFLKKITERKERKGNLFKRKNSRYEEKSVTEFSLLKIVEGGHETTSSCRVSFFAIRLVWDLNPQCCLLEAVVKCYGGLRWSARVGEKPRTAWTSLLSPPTSTSAIKYGSLCLVHNFWLYTRTQTRCGRPSRRLKQSFTWPGATTDSFTRFVIWKPISDLQYNNIFMISGYKYWGSEQKTYAF